MTPPRLPGPGHAHFGRSLPPWGRATFVWLCLILVIPPPAARGRGLAQEFDPALANAVSKEPLTVFLERQGVLNESEVLITYRQDMVAQLSGQRFVPFALADQRALIQAFREVILPVQGPVELTTYKEVYPDPASPERMREKAPATELAFTVYWAVNKTDLESREQNSTWEAAGNIAISSYISCWQRAAAIGGWPPEMPRVLALGIYPENLTGGYTLQPLMAMNVQLAVALGDASGDSGSSEISTEQISVVNAVVEAAVVGGGFGQLVEAIGSSSQIVAAAKARRRRLQDNAALQQQILLEVTMFACREGATKPSPECEVELLEAVLRQALQAEAAAEQWRAAGIQTVEVASIGQRPAPPVPAAAQPSQQPDWVPWHLDRIDQRSLPLDGKFSATASGSGVHVYMLSSGVRGDHEEFQKLDGSGSRAKAAWGYLGLDPLSDCDDYVWWYGYGTFEASLCCGQTMGAAKNSTIHSVRFRQRCLSDANIWSAGALPSAIDLVLSTHVKPAVVHIGTWLYKERPGVLSPSYIAAALQERLDKLGAANITVIAPAGTVPYSDPCDNIIAAHPAVISVAASDTWDQYTALGPWNSSCIDIWAPGGGLGSGLTAASAAGPTNYTKIINRAFGAAAIVTGVVAQYLQLHPEAGPAEVKRYLQEGATQQAIRGAGPASTPSLLFTDCQNPSQPQPGSGLSAGAIAGIAVAACAAVATATLVVFVFVKGKQRRDVRDSPLHSRLKGSEWEIAYDDIEICKRPDGSDWLLGEGMQGKVYRAIKGGLQVVAVKQLGQINERLRELFVKEADIMKYVSRDANITQFYGACIKGEDMRLVFELMEGGDLRNALSADHARELQWYRRGKDVVLDVLKGLHFLHTHHVVHRDIKSKNILLGRDWRAKIADVGLAKLQLHGEGGKQDPPDAGGNSKNFVGTLAWAGPEALLGEQCTEKSDIYSFGVVLWEMVTLEMPKRGRLRDPEVPRECPQEVADAIRACMQREPAHRPSARQLYATLLACAPNGNYEQAPSPPEGNSELSGVAAVAETSGGVAEGSGQMPLERKASRSSESTLTSGTTKGSQLSSAELSLLTIDFEQVEFCSNEDGTKQQLGSGSFGAVYKVLLDGVQPLAAKVVDLGQDPKFHSAFLKEAALLWRLRHRNVVGLSCVSIAEGRGFLLMELMEGGSLYRMLNLVNKSNKQRVFGWYNRGKQVMLDIARGLHYLHSLHITHFDLKSGNVLLTRELTAKVSDVGLARVMSCTHHSLSYEDSMGTFAYMAPELLAGSKCTHAVDIYSFGILLWEVCTGTYPVRGRMAELQVPEECPQAVADLHLQCTAANPADRPTARDVVERLTLLTLVSGVKVAPDVPPASVRLGPITPAQSINLQPLVSPFQALSMGSGSD